MAQREDHTNSSPPLAKQQMIIWKWKHFSDLSTKELYECMVLRQAVFVIEQSCLYLDADGKDSNAYHLMGYQENEMVAYARILNPGVSYSEVSIGRVVTSTTIRKTGVGIELMEKALDHIKTTFGEVDVRLSAQSYLLDFYQKFGFRSTGKEYLEDDIPHTEMLRTVKKN